MRIVIQGVKSLRLAQLLVAMFLLMAAGNAFAATAIIGGNICKGAKLPDGSPQLMCDPVDAPATVMVQDMHGNFIADGLVNGSAWEVEVPSPGEYLAVIVAEGYDATSREFDVKANYASVMLDAYLPALPLPRANLLVYTFIDNYVNSEDDFPADLPMSGVELIVKNEHGVEVARATTGTSPTLPPGAGPDPAGLFYFTNLEPGDYVVVPNLDNLPPSPSGNGWYQNTSIEGTMEWEVTLYPGDPGTVDGGYMAWFSFIDKLPANMPARADGGTITGRLYDADGPWFPLEEPFSPPQPDLVTPNWYVPHGLVVLYPTQPIQLADNTTQIAPIATAEARTGTPAQIALGEQDPVTGTFEFTNVPPGSYKLFVVDALSENPETSNIPKLAYIWQQKQVTVTAGQTVHTDIFLPRWFARIHGTVMDTINNAPMEGLNVRLRLKDGSIWKETTTGPDGKYLFDELAEVEVLGYVDVEAPAGYRGVVDADKFDLSTKTVQWYACNYKADLMLEAIPASESVIRGFVYNDELAAGTWQPDSLYSPDEERTIHGVPVSLLDENGLPVLDQNGAPIVTTTGKTNNASLVAQGWLPPYITYPPDEFGGVFKGYVPGFYEFRGIAPGNYKVALSTPLGFSNSPAGTDIQAVAVAGGASATVNFGVYTKAPLSGEIEGGIFDDLNLDTNIYSVLWDEKKAIVGAPLGIYDHNGYFLGSTIMGNPLCHPTSPYVSDLSVCPTGTEKPEVERHVVHGPHIFVGNDPSLPGHKEDYEPLPWTYSFGQGKYKFEADWSLMPISMIELGAPMAVLNLYPQNPPVIVEAVVVAPVAFNNIGAMLAMNGFGPVLSDSGYIVIAKNDKENERIHDDKKKSSKRKKKKNRDFDGDDYGHNGPGGDVNTPQQQVVIRITGSNFGSSQAYSTVSISGKKLEIISWSDTVIEASTKPTAVSGPLVVATSTGVSNAININLDTAYSNNITANAFYVDVNAPAGGNGSKTSPFNTIQDALNAQSSSSPAYIFVMPGVYNENLWIRRNNVKIIGSGPNETVINGRKPLRFTSSGIEPSGPVFTIGKGGIEGGVSNILISGFTVKGGSVKGGIFADYGNTNIDINNCIIIHNGGEYGGGIWLHNSNQNVDIWSNIIARNGNWGGYGGGISVNDEPEYGTGTSAYGSPTHHTADDNKPAPTTSYNIYNNLIYHNFSMDYGGGISLYEVKDKLNVYGNVLMENRADDHGGAMFFEDSGPADIYGNVMLRNYAADDGGAISFEDVGDLVATVNIYNNLMAENVADDRNESTACGGALAFDDTFDVSIYNNTITGNIVAGSLNPRGAAIDSERNGHEYLDKAPGYSDPRIFNNIIWNNWKLEYDVPVRGGEMMVNFTTGTNYRWTPDNLHVDNPALQQPWEAHLNSESFTFVHNNIISGGYSNGTGNLDIDPVFAAPATLDWHLAVNSPASNSAPAVTSAKYDLDMNRRIGVENGSGIMVDMGAYEMLVPQPSGMRLPEGILGAIAIPRP